MWAPASEQLMDFGQQSCMFFWGKLCFSTSPFFFSLARKKFRRDPVGMMGGIKRFLRRLLRSVMLGACVAKRLHGPSAAIKQACFLMQKFQAAARPWMWWMCLCRGYPSQSSCCHLLTHLVHSAQTVCPHMSMRPGSDFSCEFVQCAQVILPIFCFQGWGFSPDDCASFWDRLAVLPGTVLTGRWQSGRLPPRDGQCCGSGSRRGSGALL